MTSADTSAAGKSLGSPGSRSRKSPRWAPYRFGVLSIPGKRPIGCMTPLYENAFEAWRTLAILSGIFEAVPVDYPIDLVRPATGEVNTLLSGRASLVFAQVPFTFGTRGEEASGLAPTAERASAATLQGPRLIVPTNLFNGFDLTPRGITLREGLWWKGP